MCVCVSVCVFVFVCVTLDVLECTVNGQRAHINVDMYSCSFLLLRVDICILGVHMHWSVCVCVCEDLQVIWGAGRDVRWMESDSISYPIQFN